MINRIVFATGNEGKMKEIRMILSDLGLPILSMKEAGVYSDAEETGTTFEENAVIKAKSIQAEEHDLVLADDSGLVIDALGGEPGVMSARYMGYDTPYQLKNQRILDRMRDVPEEKRNARFVCAIAAVLPGGEILTASGTMEGRIAREIAGVNGFGYDPIFYLPRFHCTSAEISAEVKNQLSHRGKALENIKIMLEKYK